MCFSAEASFIGAAVLGTVGYCTLTEVTDKRQLPLAIIPLLFAFQQVCEGVIWMFLNNNLAPSAAFWVCTYAYVWLSYIMWPTWFSFSSFLLEKVAWRRKALAACIVGGLFVSGYDLNYVIHSTMDPHIVQNSVYYLQGSKLIGAMYLASVALAFLFSSTPYMWLMGAAAPFSFGLSAYLYWNNFASVWCFAASVLSIIIFFAIREDSKQRVLVRDYTRRG